MSRTKCWNRNYAHLILRRPAAPFPPPCPRVLPISPMAKFGLGYISSKLHNAHIDLNRFVLGMRIGFLCMRTPDHFPRPRHVSKRILLLRGRYMLPFASKRCKGTTTIAAYLRKQDTLRSPSCVNSLGTFEALLGYLLHVLMLHRMSHNLNRGL